jgi:acylpyruvate hydrolase
MKLVTLDTGPGGRTGVVIGDDVLDFARAAAFVPLAAWVPAAMPALLAARNDGLEIVRRVADEVQRRSADEQAAMRADGALRDYDDCALLAPVPLPGIVLSHGRAYAAHRKAMRGDLYDPTADYGQPSAFLKNGSSIIGTGKPIRLPASNPNMVDLEAEFSVVFGSDCHQVDEADALNYVAGYTMINDVSARDWVEESRVTNNMDMVRISKQFATFTPIGPAIVTADEIADPNDVHLGSSINGNVMQDANTSGLIWRVEFLIAYFSRFYPFRAGDILTTGSPAGNGFGRKPPVFLQPGDIVSVYSDRIGSLTNPVVAP